MITAPWQNQTWMAVPGKYAGLKSPELRSLARLVWDYTSTAPTVSVERPVCSIRGPVAFSGRLDVRGYPAKSIELLLKFGAIKRLNHNQVALDWGGSDDLVIRKVARSRSAPADTTRLDQGTSRHSVGARHVLKTLTEITLPDGWSPDGHGLSPDAACRLQAAAVKLMDRRFNLRKGPRVDRLFHLLINSGSKELRNHVEHEGKRMMEVDIQQAHPVMLCSIVHEREADAYWRVLEGDVYKVLGAGIPRDQAKVEFQTLLAGTIHATYTLHRAFLQQFPRTGETIKNLRTTGETLQARLQNLEAVIMIAGVGCDCSHDGIPFISLHDGCLVPPSFDPERVKVAFHDVLGFPCRLHVENPVPFQVG